MAMADDKKLTDIFQNMLEKHQSDQNLCSTLETVNTAFNDLQQFLTKQGIAFTFSFAPPEAISAALHDQLASVSNKTRKFTAERLSTLSYTIDGAAYPLAIARAHEEICEIHYEYDEFGDSYEYPSKTSDENYEVIFSENNAFRFDTENDDPLETLKTHIVEQAATQKFLHNYSAKNQPRRIQRTARQV